MLKWFCGLVLIGIIQLFMIGHVLALSIYPPMIEVELTPGETSSTNFYITVDEQNTRISSRIISWKLTADQSVFYTSDDTSWLTFNDYKDYLVTSNKRVMRPMTFTAPSDFVGERKAYFSVVQLAEDSPYATELKIPIYIMSDKDRVLDIDVVEFTSGFGVTSTANDEIIGNFNTHTVLHNKGNVHVRPDISVKLKNLQSNDYVKNSVGGEEFVIARDWPVFPEADRIIDNSVNDLILPGHGRYQIEMRANFKYLFKDALTYSKQYEVDL